MKNKICNFLTEHIKWVFSGIGIVLISSVINNTCSNGAEDKKTTVTNNSGIITRDISGTINSGDKVNGDKFSGDKVGRDKITAETIHYGDKITGDKVSGDKVDGDKISGDKIIYSPPSYREATIVQGENGNPVGVIDNPDVLNSATKLLTRLFSGENVDIQEAYNTTSPKFLVNSGTEIATLESSGTGFAEFVKVKILEGAHKDETGWIHASTIHQKQRRK